MHHHQNNNNFKNLKQLLRETELLKYPSIPYAHSQSNNMEDESNKWLELLAVIGSEGNETADVGADFVVENQESSSLSASLHHDLEPSTPKVSDLQAPSKPYELYIPVFERVYDDDYDSEGELEAAPRDTSSSSSPAPSSPTIISVAESIPSAISSVIPQFISVVSRAATKNQDKGILNGV